MEKIKEIIGATEQRIELFKEQHNIIDHHLQALGEAYDSYDSSRVGLLGVLALESLAYKEIKKALGFKVNEPTLYDYYP